MGFQIQDHITHVISTHSEARLPKGSPSPERGRLHGMGEGTNYLTTMAIADGGIEFPVNRGDVIRNIHFSRKLSLAIFACTGQPEQSVSCGMRIQALYQFF